MPFKTITIKESAYDKLKAAKKQDESFTELIERSFKDEKPDIMKYAGAWSDMTDEEYEDMMERIYDERRRAERDFNRRMKDVLS